MQHTKHLWRAGLILLILPVTYILMRYFMMPPSFGEIGFYRASNLQEQMDKPLEHAPRESCVACHEKQATEHDGGKHKAVNCQACHGPLEAHVKAPGKFGRPEVPLVCLRCHEALRARPKGFPQVEPRKHLEDMGGMTLEPGVCLNCHNPHSPGMDAPASDTPSTDAAAPASPTPGSSTP